MKTCSVCNQEKEGVHKNKCRTCYTRIRRQNNPEARRKNIENNARWVKSHPERHNFLTSKSQFRKNKPLVIKRLKQYQDFFPEFEIKFKEIL